MKKSKKERNELSAKTQFKEAKNYLKESKKYIYFTILLFIFTAGAGFLLRSELTFLDEIIKDLVAKTSGLNAIEMIFFIMQNNMLSALLSMALGIFLGIFPIISSVSNRVLLGYVLGKVYDVSGFVDLWRLLPHGIFELPAIFISFGLGIKIGMTIFTKKKDKIKEFKRRFYNSANVFLMIIIPLLIIAAVIEGILISLLG